MAHNRMFFAAIAAATIVSFPGGAQADLVSLDLVPGSGDRLITRDTTTGMDWLSFSATLGQSFEQVRAGSWSAQGFRYATLQEAVALLAPSSYSLAIQLGAPGGQIYGLVGTDDQGAQVSLDNHPIGTVFPVAVVGAVYPEELNSQTGLPVTGPLGSRPSQFMDALLQSAVAQAQQGGAGNNLGVYQRLVDSQTSAPYVGSFLVRASPVPEPGGNILMGLGLAAIGCIARNRRAAFPRLQFPERGRS